MQVYSYISHCQTTAFGNTEKGCFWNMQNAGNQCLFPYQTVTPSTGKEKDYETGYYNFGARYYDPVLSGLFLSVDPMSDKYPSLSPYAYCAWNPVKLVDPNGMDIIIKGRKNNITYTPGMSSDGLDSFTKQAVNALNTIYAVKAGKELIDDLSKSSNNYKIVKSNLNGFDIDDGNTLKAYKKQFLTDPKYEGGYDALRDKNSIEGGSGGIIRWNPSGTLLPTTENSGSINSMIDLAHEMFHAKDANHGLLDDRSECGVKRDEWQAVYNENILRGQMDLPLRTHYETLYDESGAYKGGSGPNMLNDGQPIKPIWYEQ